MKPVINWHPSKKEMFHFGMVMFIGLGLVGLLFYGRGSHRTAAILWGCGGVLGALSTFLPFIAKPIYWLWMGIGWVLGSLSSRLVMILIFYGVLTPLALIFRLMGRDELRIKKPSAPTTYWQNHPAAKHKSDYDHLF